MAYGIIKVDTIIFDQGGADQNVTVSGIYRAITSGVTVSGTISGAVLVGTTTVSGATVTGTTANFVSGVFTTVVSGATVTGTQSSFTSGNFVTLSGATATFTSAVIASGTAAAPSLSIISDPNTGIYSPGADQVAVATNGTGRLFVTSAGLIGVGQSSPGSALDVDGEIRIYPSSGAGNLRFGSGGVEKGKVAVDASSNYTVETAGSERLRITSAGLVGIGTSSPAAALDIGGTFQSVRTYLPSVTDTYHLYRGTPDSTGFEHARVFSGRDTSVHTYGSYLAFYTEGKSSGTTDTSVERLRIDSSGRVGIGTSAPGTLTHLRGTNATTNFTINNPSGLFTLQDTSSSAGAGAKIAFGASYDGTNSLGQAIIGASKESGTGSGADQYRSSLVFHTSNYASGVRETMRLDPDGRVGIGTSAPNEALHIASGGARISSSLIGGGASSLGLDYESSNARFISYGPDVSTQTGFIFLTGNSTASTTIERLRITAAGNVGIGTTSPSDKLEARGGAVVVGFSDNTTRTNKLFAGFGYETGGTLYGNVSIRSNYDNTNNSSTLNFHTASGAGADTERARIDSSGRLLVGTSTARSTFYSTASAFIQIEGGAASGSESLAIVRNVNDTFGGSLILAKTRGAGDTIVTSGDTIGNVTWQGNDGSKFVQAARIEAQVDGTPGTNDMPGRLVFFTTADGQATPTERMRIDALGALKTSPNGTYKFPAGTTEITHNDATSSVQLIASSTGFTSDAVTISTYRNTVNDSYKFLSCIRQGFAVALEIRDDGDVYNVNGTYGSLSDVKLKENIVDANSQWDDIRQLRVRNYNFKPETNNSTHKQIGVIAQEIEDVSPGLVNTVPDRDEDGNDLGTVTKSVNYSVLYMKAVKALQEAMERIETLEARLAAAGIE